MPEALQRKIVGLPAWAWIAVVGAGLTIGLILRSRNSAEEAAAEEVIYEDDPVLMDDESLYNDPTDAGYYVADPGYTLGGAPDTAYGAYNLDEDYLAQTIGETLTVWLEDNMPEATEPDGEPAPTTGDGNNKGCKGRKPSTPKGYHAECHNNRWKVVANNRGKGGQHDNGKPDKDDDDKPGKGGKHDGGKGGGKNGGKGKNRTAANPVSTRVVTGGGPPRRRGIHTPNNRNRQGPQIAAAVRRDERRGR